MIVMMVWFFYFVILLLLVVVYFNKYVRLLCLAFRMPGPRALPIIGNIMALNHLSKSMDEYVIKYQSERLFRIWITVFPYFVLMHPKDIRFVLHNNKLTKKNSLFCNLMESIVGEGLITSSGSKWEANRRAIQNVFNMNNLKAFVNVFSEYAEDVAKLLEDKNDVNITYYINKFGIRTSWHTILGISGPCSDDELLRRQKMLTGHNKIDFWTIIGAMCKHISLNKGKKIIKTQLRQLIEELIAKYREQKTPTDFKSLMSCISEIPEDSKDFTEEDVINETTTLIHASYDTIRSALTFALYMLAKHQEAQEKVAEELDSILVNKKHSTIDDVNQMQYLEQCIKESMRLYPSAPLLFRETIEKTKFGDVVLPEGANLLISPYLIHRDPHFFSDPLKFDPDRFSKENISKIEAYSYIPFSMGPRNCIGYKYAILQMKTFIASILRTYHISITPAHEELNLVFNVTLVNRGGMWLRFQKRNRNIRTVCKKYI